jgi:hypothetical protein
MEDKDKINFDLNFLDENTKEKPKQTPKQKSGDSKDPNWVYHKDTPKEKTLNSDSGGMSDSVISWAWVIGIALLFIVIGSFSDDSGTSSTSSTPTNTASSGHTFTSGSGQTFSCSDYNYDKAIAMRPTDAESTALDNRVSASETSRAAIEDMYVDEYDQDSLDTYNAAVDNFNYRNNRLKSDLAAFDAKVDAYNNYLDAHCTLK